MGDPGLPLMAGLLAVPVAVLLVVVVLALVGGRWAVPSPAAVGEFEEPALDDPFESLALPYTPQRPTHALPAPRSYGPGEHGPRALPAAQAPRALPAPPPPPRGPIALPAASEPRDRGPRERRRPGRHAYGSLARGQDRPAGPEQRPSPPEEFEGFPPPDRYGYPGHPVQRVPEPPPYGTQDRAGGSGGYAEGQGGYDTRQPRSYGSGGRHANRPPGPYGQQRDDDPDAERPRGFPYGPYRHD